MYKTTYTYKRFEQWFIDSIETYTNNKMFIEISISIIEQGIDCIILETEKI